MALSAIAELLRTDEDCAVNRGYRQGRLRFRTCDRKKRLAVHGRQDTLSQPMFEDSSASWQHLDASVGEADFSSRSPATCLSSGQTCVERRAVPQGYSIHTRLCGGGPISSLISLSVKPSSCSCLIPFTTFTSCGTYITIPGRGPRRGLQ